MGGYMGGGEGHAGGDQGAGERLVRLGARFSDATLWAAELHSNQRRKDSRVPYVSHLLAVASLVLEDGGSEDEAIAALLHDAIEDAGVERGDIATRYGEDVASIVVACTDGLEHAQRGEARDAASWRSRKEAYLHHLDHPATPSGVLRVSAADKVHNARSIVADLRRRGDAAWGRFNAPRDDQLWYYGELARILAARHGGRLSEELVCLVEEMGRLSRGLGGGAARRG